MTYPSLDPPPATAARDLFLSDFLRSLPPLEPLPVTTAEAFFLTFLNKSALHTKVVRMKILPCEIRSKVASDFLRQIPHNTLTSLPGTHTTQWPLRLRLLATEQVAFSLNRTCLFYILIRFKGTKVHSWAWMNQ